MLLSFFKRPKDSSGVVPVDYKHRLKLPFVRTRWWMLIVVPAWVYLGFATSELLVQAVLWILVSAGVPLATIDQSVLSASAAALLYVITILIVIGLPWLIKKQKTSRVDVALDSLPTWTDILLAPAGFVIYLVLSGLLILLVTNLFPGFSVSQAQDTGFTNLSHQYEYILAFFTLVIVAPVAEELLFRGYLLGKLGKYTPIWISVLVASLLFGYLHLGVGPQYAWGLAIDTFALSLVLCSLRLVTGRLWSPMLLHMLKNGIAFFIIFINPLLSHTLGG